MVVLEPGIPPLNLQGLSLYYAKDALLGNFPVIVFYGPSTTTNSTQNSSRIQAHVFSVAGYQSFSRLTISPTSPLYAAVHCLPDNQQGDEVCRGLAVSLFKYFLELPSTVKKRLSDQAGAEQSARKALRLFDETHAADLAGAMAVVENPSIIATKLRSALPQKCLSWTDVEVILPQGSTRKLDPSETPSALDENDVFSNEGRSSIDYGQFDEVVRLFGSPAFLPTSRIKRAPSKPTVWNQSLYLSEDQIQSLRREMIELLETEKSYVIKISELDQILATENRPNAMHYSSTMQSGRSAVQELLPVNLDQICEINNKFLEQLRALMGDADLRFSKIACAEGHWFTGKDPSGTDSFAQIFLDFLPKFKSPYQEYLRKHNESLRILSGIMRDGVSGLARALQPIGEQRIRGYLIEPVQRLPRYSLLIDNMVNQLPATHPALFKLLKAKDLIADICALDDDESRSQTKTIQVLKSLIANWRDHLAPRGRLLTAVDVTELKAPYAIHSGSKHDSSSMLLLFPDDIFVLRKIDGSSLSARGLLAEIDRPRTAGLRQLMPGNAAALQHPLSLAHAYKLNETRFAESDDGRIITLSCVRKASSDEANPGRNLDCSASIRVYELHGAYEGKAARWNEEIARARIEYRFPESMRENERWSLRVTSPQKDSLGIVSAIFENDIEAEKDMQRRASGRIGIVIQIAGDETFGHSFWDDDNNTGIEIKGRITILEPHKFRLELKSTEETASQEVIWAADLAEVFIKRCKF